MAKKEKEEKKRKKEKPIYLPVDDEYWEEEKAEE